MARGPTPKPGEMLGHYPAAKRAARRGMNPEDAPTPKPRPLPAGDWGQASRAWWEAVANSFAAATLWQDEDWLAAARGLKLVNHFDACDNPKTLVTIADAIRRIEIQLYCTPAERVRIGLHINRPAPELESRDRHPASRSGNARLRLLGDADKGA